MLRRILSVSYDEQLLTTRGWLLVRAGYEVTSVHGLAEAVAWCRKSAFDLIILGHSIPGSDKELLMRAFRQYCAARVLSLRRQGDAPVSGADHQAFSDSPAALLETVADIFAKGKSRPETKPPPKSPAQSYTLLSAESKGHKEKDDRRR